MSRNISLNGKQGNRHQKKSQKYLCSKHYKKSLNNTLNTNEGTDGQTLGRLKRIIIVALKTCKSKFVSPILEYAVPVWKNIPEFLASNIESIEKGLCVSFVVRTITMRLYLHFLSLTLNMRRESTCVRLQNENHPLHIILPKLEEVQHDYQLKSGASYRLAQFVRPKDQAHSRFYHF